MRAKSPSPGPSGPPERIERLQAELAEARARALALEKRLEGCTADLRLAQDELRRTNTELLQLTLDLDARVAQRTAELAQTVETLRAEVAKRTLAEEVLWQRSLQLRALASELTLAEQRERRRLAEVLHDDLQQLLVGARLQLNGLQRLPEKGVSQTAGDVEELINRALEVSRSLTHELSPPILHAGELVPALEWLARWMHQRHGLQVALKTTDAVTPASEDLRLMLFQAVRELLFNVVKHAKAAKASLAVGRLGDRIQIVVEDEGAGFDPAQLRGTGEGGRGFGLFSIRERLDVLGGSLEIVTAPGKGSRITLVTPLGPPAAGTEGTPPRPSGEKRLPDTAAGKRIRVLVVDDHAIVRQGLVRLFTAAPDLEVVGEASGGRGAVELTRRLQPDVVVMDVSMRQGGGIEATRAIHAELPQVQVIGLSMYDDAEQGEEVRQAGAVSYVSKVGPSENLIAAIRACRPGSTAG